MLTFNNQTDKDNSQASHPESCTIMCPIEIVRECFIQLSKEIKEEIPDLRISSNDIILRGDVMSCLEESFRRPLTISELSDVQRCFILESCPLIDWQEFRESYEHFMETRTNHLDPNRSIRKPFTKSRARLLALRKKGIVPAKESMDQPMMPATTSQDIGWFHKNAFKNKNITLVEKYAPLKGSDITRGNEGRNWSTYYGPSLRLP